jgi:hypothetical protein
MHGAGRRLGSLRLEGHVARRAGPRLEHALPHLQGLLHRARHHSLSPHLLFAVYSAQFIDRGCLSGVSRDQYFR